MTNMLSTLFCYQAWANGAFCDKLLLVDRARNEDAYLRAMRLMNHTCVVAQIFAAHLTNRAHGYQTDNTVETPDIPTLRRAMAACDNWYLDYVGQVAAGEITAAELGEKIAFTFTDGDKGYMSREEMLTHVVLHGGYHRGEVGRILTELAVETPWDTFAVFLHGDDPTRRLQGVLALAG